MAKSKKSKKGSTKPKKVAVKSKKTSKSADTPILLPARIESASTNPIEELAEEIATRPLSNRWLPAYIGLNAVFVTALIFGLVLNIALLQHASRASLADAHIRGGKVLSDYRMLAHDVGDFEGDQAANNLPIVDSSIMEKQLVSIQIEASVGKYHKARRDITTLRTQLTGYEGAFQSALAKRKAEMATKSAAVAAPASTSGIRVPILLYHYTPSDFERILSTLQQRGYTAITLDELSAALRHTGTLPAKPVIITFDDGFSNQMVAFRILQSHNMKAVYYIVNGGERSKWCIGAGRRSGDPLQPPGGCGDSYLSWDEIRELDRSGIITIGSHTVDHEALATDSPEIQTFEILQGKAQLEAQLGHSVLHFAYPYGSFNPTTISLVRQAGFITATTTLTGDTHTPDTIYTLRRVRDAYSLH